MEFNYREEYPTVDIGESIFDACRLAYIGDMSELSRINYEIKFKLLTTKGKPLKRISPIADVNDWSSELMINEKALNIFNALPTFKESVYQILRI